MNTQKAISKKETTLITKEDSLKFYKIYAGFEKDRNGKILSLEIIDGYLKPNECLSLRKEMALGNGISYFEVDIVPSNQINTYLKIPVYQNLSNSVMIKVFRKGHLEGFQLIDLEGNILVK
jgi:hypothetical protein